MAAPCLADTLRIATFAAPLSRDGPGLLLRDILSNDDPQIAAVQAVIAQTAADVLVLTDFDYDLDGIALHAFADSLDPLYPYRFARQPNAGLATGLDIDGNGRLGEPRDAQGYGRFEGDGGLAVLSRFPIDVDAVTNLSAVLWKDLPGAILPQSDGTAFHNPAIQDRLRLSSTAHWIVPIVPPQAPAFAIMAFSATPPVFDGPEDMNGLRNRDELRLWQVVLDAGFGPPPRRFVIAGNANLDPLAGDGLSDAMAQFLRDPRLQDPLPGQHTASWPEDGPGNLRVSYVLPSANWRVTDAAVIRPDAVSDLIGPHHMVWVDIDW